MSGPAQKTVTTQDFIASGDTTGPVGAVRMSRTATGLQLSVDGAAPVEIGTDIPAGTVTLAQMANLAANSVIGNNTGSPATPIALTAAQQTAMLNNATAALKGLYPGLDPWYTNAIIAAEALGCTEWNVFGPTAFASGFATSFTDNGFEGGSTQKTNGTAYCPGQTIFQNPKGTTKWYVKLRFKQSKVSASGEFSQLGLLDSGGHGISFLDNNGTFTGNWYTKIFDGTNTDPSPNGLDSGIAVDTNWHDLEFSHVSTNAIIKLDGAQIASIVDTHLTTSPVCLAAVISATMVTRFRKVFWGFDGSGV